MTIMMTLSTVSNIKKHASLLHDGAIIDNLKLCRNNKENVTKKLLYFC